MRSTSSLLRLSRGIGLSCIWGRKHHGYRLRKANRFCFLWPFQMTWEWGEKGSWRFQVLLFHCPCSSEHLWALAASQGCAWLSRFLMVLAFHAFLCIPFLCVQRRIWNCLHLHLLKVTFFFSNLHARIPVLKAYIICVTQLLVPAALAVQHNHGSSHVSYLCFAATIFRSCCKSSLGFLNWQYYSYFALSIILKCGTEGAKRRGQQ